MWGLRPHDIRPVLRTGRLTIICLRSLVAIAAVLYLAFTQRLGPKAVEWGLRPHEILPVLRTGCAEVKRTAGRGCNSLRRLITALVGEGIENNYVGLQCAISYTSYSANL